MVDMVTEIALSSYENSGTDICWDRDLFDLEYTGDVVLLSKLHDFLNNER